MIRPITNRQQIEFDATGSSQGPPASETCPSDFTDRSAIWPTSWRGFAPRLALGSALGLLALWLATRGIQWPALRAALSGIRFSFVLLALLTVAITLLASTARWRLLFYPNHHQLSWRSLFNGIVLAQMLNIIVPARLGDLTRAYALGRDANISKVRIMTSIVVEKAADLGTLALAVVFFLITVTLPAWLRDSGQALLLGTFVSFAILMILVFRGPALLRWLERWAEKLPETWGARLAGYGRSTLEGFNSIRRGWISGSVWGLSVIIMFLAALSNYLLFLALDLKAPPIAALFLLVVLQVGMAPPSVPGKIGVFHYLTVLGLSVYSVEKSVALSYAIVLYCVALLPKIFLGTVILGMTEKSHARKAMGELNREGAKNAKKDSKETKTHTDTGGWAVSVVVPCLNEATSIERLLDAVRLQDTTVLEVIVVDGGSTDGTQTILESYRKEYPSFSLNTLIRPHITLPEAINTAVRASEGQVIVRLDAHSQPTPGYVRQCVEALRETEAGVVGGIWETEAGASTATAKAIAYAVSHPLGAGDAAYRIARASSGRHSIDTVPFGCFRKSTWKELGGYNERLRISEDYEFNYRARTAHRPVILDTAIRCTYVARASLAELSAQYFRYGWWKTKMLKQHPRSLRWRQAVLVGFVGTLLVLLCMAMFSGFAKIALAALVGMYGMVLVGTALSLRNKVQDGRVAAILPLAFLTVHLSWGTGALVNLMTLGKWPRWGAPR